MALFGKDRERNERPRVAGYETVVPEATAGNPSMMDAQRGSVGPESAGSSRAFLGKGSRVTGRLVFEGPAHIEGQVDGEISAEDSLTIGEGALVNAQISGVSIVIHGRVTGDISARTRLEIRAPGAVFGNISTPNLVIHDGVTFEGSCSMGSVDAQRDRRLALVAKEAGA